MISTSHSYKQNRLAGNKAGYQIYFRLMNLFSDTVNSYKNRPFCNVTRDYISFPVLHFV